MHGSFNRTGQDRRCQDRNSVRAPAKALAVKIKAGGMVAAQRRKADGLKARVKDLAPALELYSTAEPCASEPTPRSSMTKSSHSLMSIIADS